MSLINDALRRASQTEKDRPRPVAAPLVMEPVVRKSGSGISVLLAGIVVVALAAAGWFFHQWWTVRSKPPAEVVVTSVPAPVAPKVVAPPVAPKVEPAAIPAPVTPPTPAPAPVPVAVATPPPVTAPVVAAASAQASESQAVWPVRIKVSAIFYNDTNPRVLISGDIYHVGDEVGGAVIIKKIDKDKVTAEWNGHTKVFRMENE